MEADPECRWCRGTGEITLLTSVVACECIFLPKTEKEHREPRVHIGWGYHHDQDEHGRGD